MNPFFWRVFLSVWGVIFAILALTGAVALLLLPDSGTIEVGEITEQMTELIARDLRHELAADTALRVGDLASSYDLDQTPFQVVYIVDPDGKDVLGRTLPSAVVERLSNSNEPRDAERANAGRLQIRSEGLAGYKVIGVRGFFPLERMIVKPGVRGVLLVFSILCSAVISLLLAQFIGRPVRELRIAGHKVASGDLSVRVAPSVGRRSDDIARLAHDFDLMTKKVDVLLQSRHRLLRDVSHELRSPLARMQALLSIQRQAADAAGTQAIDRMENEVERLDALIGEILEYSRLEVAESVDRHATDLVDLVQTVVDDASLEGEAVGKRIELHAPQALVVDVDSRLLQRAVENVVRNALKFSADGEAVDVTLSRDAMGVRIIVDDHGPGVPEESLTRIFEPFYRVGNARNAQSMGGGIGLAITDRSISLHGGTITAHNRPKGGLRVVLQLPLPAATAI